MITAGALVLLHSRGKCTFPGLRAVHVTGTQPGSEDPATNPGGQGEAFTMAIEELVSELMTIEALATGCTARATVAVGKTAAAIESAAR
jgi:hypothetical protein